MAAKKFVCFGGGNAMPKAVLSGLKKYGFDITTVTSMVDSGGSTGQLRKDFDVLPPGDIRRHLLALSQAPQWKKDLFAFRFGHEVFDGGHKGHNFANIFIAGLEYILKDYGKALEITHQFLEVKGRCLPATIGKTNIFAVLENGAIAEGEDEIDVPKNHDGNLKIEKIFLKPEAEAYKQALDAVKQADAITIGPGDLYSSLLPCFLPKGMQDAMKASGAKKIFICPAMTKFGETNGFTVLDFANEAEKYAGCELDFVIYNTGAPSDERVNSYKEKEPSIRNLVEVNGGLDKGKFIGADILADSGDIVYDPGKLSRVISDVCE